MKLLGINVFCCENKMQDKGDAVKGNVLQNVQNKFKNARHYKKNINIKMQLLLNFVIFHQKTFRNREEQ